MLTQMTSSKFPHDGVHTTSYFKMFSLGILTALPNILSGMSESYSSIALAKMNLDIGTASLFAASVGYSGLVGILFIGLIIDVFGRKSALLISLLPHIIGWTLLWTNTNTLIVIFGRVLTGLTAVSTFYSSQVYAVECITVNHERLRSNFRVWPGIANSVGTLSTFFLGTFLTYTQVSGVAAILAVLVFLLIYTFIPESPAWLHMKGRIGDAELSERKLGISQPILKASSSFCNPYENKLFRFSWSQVKVEAVKLDRPDVYKPVIVMTITCALIMCTGGTVMTSFMMNIIGVNANDVSKSTPSSGLYGTISGILILIAHILVSIVLPYLGCRKLSIGTSIFMCVGMVILGLTNDHNGSDNFSLHVIAVWLVTFSFHFGVLSAPVAVMSDLFPIDAKGFASIAILTMSITTALVKQSYPYLFLYFEGNVYYGYGFACLIYAAFVFFYMPETVNRRYEQIKNDLIL